MTKTLRAIITAILLSITTVSMAQDSLRPRYGVVGGLSMNLHTAGFSALPGIPNCCPEFNSGFGLGAMFGVLYEKPLNEVLLAQFALGYNNHSALLSFNEPIKIAVNGVATDGTIKHTIDASLADIGLEAGIADRIAPQWFVNAGVRIGSMITKSYTQQEQIASPSSGTFLDSHGNDSHQRIRNVYSGTLPDANAVLMQIFGGVSYEMPMNEKKSMFLVPSISYAFSLTEVVKNLSWLPNDVRAQIAIKYSPLPTPPKKHVRDTVIERDTVINEVASNAPARTDLLKTFTTYEELNEDSIIERTTIHDTYRRDVPKPVTIECSVVGVGLDTAMHEIPNATMRVEEFMETVTYPLLGYVFFESNSSKLPMRYKQISKPEAIVYRPQQLFGEDALTINHNILNILGYNMRHIAEGTVTLRGCNANIDEEKGNVALSKARAESVRDYLVETWGIPASRIKIEADNLPMQPSNPRTPEGAEENQRVEISSSVPEIVDVFVANDTTRRISPQGMRFKTTSSSSGGIAYWTLKCRQQGTVYKSFGANGAPPASIDWMLENDQHAIPRYPAPMDVDLVMTSVEGKRDTCTTRMQLEVKTVQGKKTEKIGDFKIERYNLVLFNWGQSSINSAQLHIVDLIKKNITPESQITIEGYTDKTGSPETNVALATRRAMATMEALGRPDATVNGIGDKKLLYTNDLPEGRFYCRTVQVVVKTPVKP